ncbi:MAG: 7-cyano-7-deazaguanine synthase [Deltaproteobacteria bacterium]|nr:7-cyano-7-deazaguanine synthase [Deltaproteobacteria bacterium]
MRSWGPHTDVGEGKGRGVGRGEEGGEDVGPGHQDGQGRDHPYCQGLGVDNAETHSCYDPFSSEDACGRCESCVQRKRGFKEERLPQAFEEIRPFVNR